MTDHFSSKIGVRFFAQETHDIRAAKSADAAAHQGRVNLGQGSRRFEHDVRGPFTLVSRPIVGFPEGSQHRLMDGFRRRAIASSTGGQWVRNCRSIKA